MGLQDDAEAMITATVCGGDEACIKESLERLGHADAANKASSLQAGGNGNGGGREYQNGSSGGDESRGGSGAGSDGDSSNGRDGSGGWPDDQQQLGVGWEQRAGGNGSVAAAAVPPHVAAQRRAGGGNGSSAAAELTLDLDSWQQIGFPNAVLAAVVACKNGVKRAHLIDSDSDG